MWWTFIHVFQATKLRKIKEMRVQKHMRKPIRKRDLEQKTLLDSTKYIYSIFMNSFSFFSYTLYSSVNYTIVELEECQLFLT